MKDFIQTLTSEQLEAVTSPDSVLLTAIPGSGKTRSLINKIIHEFNEDDNRYIVAITYTRRAAFEIEDRIIEQLGFLPPNIWVGTIHKFCLEFIVRSYGSYSNFFSKNFQVISDSEQSKIKDELRKKHSLFHPYTTIDYTLDTAGNPNEETFPEIVEEYFQVLFTLNKIDFNYILYESYRLLNSHKHICKQISNLINCLCIDEYQDTQELQYQILGLLGRTNPSIKLFISGDANQAIYEGIGGVTKTEAQLSAMFARSFLELHLSGCYRSNQTIIDFYQNFSINKMEMISKTDEWKLPKIVISQNKTKLGVFRQICQIITDSLAQGYKESDIVILAPQWFHLFEIAGEIRKRLPTMKLDAPDIVPLKKDEENIIYKISKLLLTTFDFHNLNRLKQITREIIKQFEDEYGIVIKHNTIDFLNLVKNSQSSDDIGTDFLFNSLTNLFNYLNLLDLFRNDVDSFVQATRERIERYQNQGIEDDKTYFEQSLRSKTGVVISTFHGVKGEEYAIVIAFGLLEGYIPHWNDIYKNYDDARKKSKKLLFVICSRAKEQIYLFAETDRATQRGKLYKLNAEIEEILLKSKQE